MAMRLRVQHVDVRQPHRGRMGSRSASAQPDEQLPRCGCPGQGAGTTRLAICMPARSGGKCQLRRHRQQSHLNCSRGVLPCLPRPSGSRLLGVQHAPATAAHRAGAGCCAYRGQRHGGAAAEQLAPMRWTAAVAAGPRDSIRPIAWAARSGARPSLRQRGQVLLGTRRGCRHSVGGLGSSKQHHVERTNTGE
jgi:hypothetical protein